MKCSVIFILLCVYVRDGEASSLSQVRPPKDPTQHTLNVIANKVLEIAQTVQENKEISLQTANSADQILKVLTHLVKTSCDDEVEVIVQELVYDPYSKGVMRQTSAEGPVTIHLPSGVNKRVRCDVSNTGEAGWTVVLSRESDEVAFNRTYAEYQEGFGDYNGNIWIGLDTLHELTTNTPHQLRVEMESLYGASAFAVYQTFSVSDAAARYKLSVSGYRRDSTAGDALQNHNGMLFSTFDLDNDRKYQSSCSLEMGSRGGWWYNSCYTTLGTGEYRKPSSRPGMNAPPGRIPKAYGGISWNPFVDVKDSLLKYKMLIKPIRN